MVTGMSSPAAAAKLAAASRWQRRSGGALGRAVLGQAAGAAIAAAEPVASSAAPSTAAAVEPEYRPVASSGAREQRGGSDGPLTAGAAGGTPRLPAAASSRLPGLRRAGRRRGRKVRGPRRPWRRQRDPRPGTRTSRRLAGRTSKASGTPAPVGGGELAAARRWRRRLAESLGRKRARPGGRGGRSRRSSRSNGRWRVGVLAPAVRFLR